MDWIDSAAHDHDNHPSANDDEQQHDDLKFYNFIDNEQLDHDILDNFEHNFFNDQLHHFEFDHEFHNDFEQHNDQFDFYKLDLDFDNSSTDDNDHSSAVMREILYVGSGKSALKINDFRNGRQTCVTNNAWRLWEDGDIWIHSGDFPTKPDKQIPKELIVSHPQYAKAARDTCEHLSIDTKSPEHYVGYTIFFQGLNWIAWNFKPCRILLLGFDHDYNMEKAKAWHEMGCPNPQNKFKGFEGRTADEVFSSFESDSFYGHGTPDPLRLSSEYFAELFDRASKTLSRLGCECFNASGVTNGLTPFPQYDQR